MDKGDLSKIKSRISFFTTLFVVLAIASLITIVLHAPAIFFAITLGAAVLIKFLVVKPMKEELLRKERKEEHDALVNMISAKNQNTDKP